MKGKIAEGKPLLVDFIEAFSGRVGTGKGEGSWRKGR